MKGCTSNSLNSGACADGKLNTERGSFWQASDRVLRARTMIGTSCWGNAGEAPPPTTASFLLWGPFCFLPTSSPAVKLLCLLSHTYWPKYCHSSPWTCLVWFEQLPSSTVSAPNSPSSEKNEITAVEGPVRSRAIFRVKEEPLWSLPPGRGHPALAMQASGPAAALVCWGRAHMSSWSGTEWQPHLIWLICSRALESSTSSAALYDIWHKQQIPSSSARGAGLCPALKPAPAPQLPSALLHALPIPLCWNLDEAAAYAKAEDHLGGLTGLFLLKMAAWILADGGIIQILLIVTKGKKAVIFGGNLSVSLMCLEKGKELFTLWVRGSQYPEEEDRGHGSAGSLSSLGELRKCPHLPVTEATSCSPLGIVSLRKGHFCLSFLNMENWAPGESHSYRTTYFPFSVGEETARSWMQWKINCEIAEGGGWVEMFTSSSREVLQTAFLSLLSFISLIPCFCVVLLHACPDMSHTTAL